MTFALVTHPGHALGPIAKGTLTWKLFSTVVPPMLITILIGEDALQRGKEIRLPMTVCPLCAP